MLWGIGFELTDERVKRITELGFAAVFEAIAKPEEERTEFEELLLNAIHWISDAEKQDRLENRITSYITAIELFFTSEEGPITRDLTESVAYLLERDLESRKNLRKKMREFYKERSKVSHEGRRQTLEETVRHLKIVAINVVAVMSKLAPELSDKKDVQQLFSDLRLSADFDPATYKKASSEETTSDDVQV